VASHGAASKRESVGIPQLGNLFADGGSVRDRYLVAIGTVGNLSKNLTNAQGRGLRVGSIATTLKTWRTLSKFWNGRTHGR
jgi:hypothetical protein